MRVCLGGVDGWEGGAGVGGVGETGYCRRATVPARNGHPGESRVQIGSRWKAEARKLVLKSGLSCFRANCP